MGFFEWLFLALLVIIGFNVLFFGTLVLIHFIEGRKKDDSGRTD